MNTETPKKTKFDILEEIMISFQDDYEAGLCSNPLGENLQKESEGKSED
ncbi:MAG: hypothetical protein ACLVAU_13490 [Ruminococcus sp.]